MKTSTKVNLILRFQITPDEINFIESLDLPIDFDNIVNIENYDVLSEQFHNILNNDKLEELVLLKIAYVYSKIKGLSFKLNPEFEDTDSEDEDETEIFFDEDPEIEEYNREREMDWKEKNKAHKEAVSKYKNYTQQQFDNMLFEYVWETYPQIMNGFDRTIYSKAKFEFTLHLGFYNMYEAPDSLRNKINKAEVNVKALLIDKFKELENSNIEDWLSEYRLWMKDSDISKCTKTNIKEFFRGKGIKASDTTFDRIKKLY
jgi:hypothetical protein